jgi:hypothetical protein
MLPWCLNTTESPNRKRVKPRILVLANDAGGANLLKSIIRIERALASWTVCTPKNSPASKVFEGMNGLEHLLLEHCDSLDEILSTRPDLLIFNPGWNYFPREAIAGKKGLGFPIAALLDHWIDYEKRLHKEDADYFIVCDNLAFDTASSASLSPILKLNNYHFKELENFDLKSENGMPNEKNLLFVSQTISLHNEIKLGIDPGFTYLGLEEGKVIENLLENFDQIAAEFQITGIRFRLHPSETEFRHHELVNNFTSIPTSLEIPSSRSLAESAKDAGVIMGINSMAIYEAHILGRPAFAIRPLPSTSITIPIPESQKLDRAVDARMADVFNKRPEYFEDHPFEKILPVMLPSI